MGSSVYVDQGCLPPLVPGWWVYFGLLEEVYLCNFFLEISSRLL